MPTRKTKYPAREDANRAVAASKRPILMSDPLGARSDGPPLDHPNPAAPARDSDASAPDSEASRSINERIFETSLDLILVVDSKGNFLRVSPSSAAILGYAPGELVGRSAADFLYPED